MACVDGLTALVFDTRFGVTSSRVETLSISHGLLAGELLGSPVYQLTDV
jgi:hypothetical protein